MNILQLSIVMKLVATEMDLYLRLLRLASKEMDYDLIYSWTL